MGCLLEFIFGTIIGGLVDLLLLTFCLTWPGVLVGLALGAAIVWVGGWPAWPWGGIGFAIGWLAAGLPYAVWLCGRWRRGEKRRFRGIRDLSRSSRFDTDN